MIYEERRALPRRGALPEYRRRNIASRNAITLRTHVCLMTAHWPVE